MATLTEKAFDKFEAIQIFEIFLSFSMVETKM